MWCVLGRGVVRHRFFVAGSWLVRDRAIMYSAWLTRRSPPQLSWCLTVLLDDAGIGDALAREANADLVSFVKSL